MSNEGPNTEISPRKEDEMSFLEHLEDLRSVLLRSLLVFLVTSGLIMAFLPVVAQVLNWPLEFAFGKGNELFREGLITTSPMAVFAVILQVTFLGGFAVTLPFFLYFLARFIAPGLTEAELRVLRPGCLAAFALFLIGALFSFMILVPAALKASLFFNEMFEYKVLWSADRYYGMLMWMTLGIGLTFEFPLLLVILVYVGILDVNRLRAFRPYSVVVFLGVAAVITPTTDPVTFLLLALPMSLLYEIAIMVSRRIEKRMKV